MSRVAALTTVDNPFDCFDQFNEWWIYDTSHCFDKDGNRFRRDCCSLLDTIASARGIPNDSLTDDENASELEDAIDEIVLYDQTGMFRKVIKEIKD